ncbi:MAG TPA: hypothetical protein ENK25_03620 [Bacteroidetes bacterium]|nr:hypothetical protein [Bacteroidota bacterium]
MKKLAWVTGIIAFLLMLGGLINFFNKGAFLGVNHAINFFHVANSTWLLTIACILMDHKFEK